MDLPTATRFAIWHAHSKKCAYCGEPVSFAELDIDRIIPENLKDNSVELERVKSDVGVASDFRMNSMVNLLPAHRHCNLKKSGQPFQPSNTRYFIELASRKEAAIHRYLDAFALRTQKERALAVLRGAIESGTLTMADVSDVEYGSRSFLLSTDLEFRDGSRLGAIPPAEVDELLDKPLLIGRSKDIDGIEFVGDYENPMVVRTCREYRAARAAGYTTKTNFDLKMEAYFKSSDAIINAVANAQVASVSYLRNPHAGVADLHLLSKRVLPYFDPDADKRIAQITEPSLRELARAKKILIVDVSSTRLQFEWEGAGAVLTELMRADLDGDGIEEILIEYFTYAVGGTLGIGTTGVLRRFGPDAMFE